MSTPQPVKPRLWPRYAVSPAGEKARVDCPGDIPPEWALEKPLPGTAPPPEQGTWTPTVAGDVVAGTQTYSVPPPIAARVPKGKAKP